MGSGYHIMEFLIDTADLAQIREAHEPGIPDGVTTNPSLMAKVGIRSEEGVMKHYEKICQIVDGDVSAEVISTNFVSIIEEGKKTCIHTSKHCCKSSNDQRWSEGIEMVSDYGIKTNCTLVFSAGHAILAAKAGANYVSPFIGRIDDGSRDELQLIQQIDHIYQLQGYKTEITCSTYTQRFAYCKMCRSPCRCLYISA
jgi:transaldolase